MFLILPLWPLISTYPSFFESPHHSLSSLCHLLFSFSLSAGPRNPFLLHSLLIFSLLSTSVIFCSLLSYLLFHHVLLVTRYLSSAFQYCRTSIYLFSVSCLSLSLLLAYRLSPLSCSPCNSIPFLSFSILQNLYLSLYLCLSLSLLLATPQHIHTSELI